MATVINKGLPLGRRVTLPPIELHGALPPPPDAPTLIDTAQAPQVQVPSGLPYTSEYDPASDLDPEARRRVLMSVQDPTQDPGFRAYVAKQAAAQAELRAAQQQAAASRDSTGMRIGNALLTFGDRPEVAQARWEQAGQPVKDVLARQASEAAGTKEAQEETALGGEMFKAGQAREAATPGTRVSQAHAMLALHQGLIGPGDVSTFTASMDDALHKGAGIQVAMKHAQAQIEQSRAALAETHSRHDEQARHDVAMENILAQRFGPGARGKPLPANVEQRLQAGIGGIGANEELRQAHHAAGLSDPLSYGQSLDALSPEIAAAKSPTGKESPLMVKQTHDAAPSRFTPDELADKYFDTTHKTLVSRLQTAISSYKKEGYDVSGMELQLAEALKHVGAPAASAGAPGRAAPASAAGTHTTPSGRVAPALPTATPIRAPSDQDLAAIDWLQKNPNDPTAEGVRARLKAKGIQ